MTSLQQAGRLSSQRSWPVPADPVALSAIFNLPVAEWVTRRPARLKGGAAPAGAPS